uniref:Uncharacterized protein n=1 Tax=Timema poppense TaxID=170557 RepID=A0A7R9DXG9_TIMPO|nr:unnamed protein product [Timema poppensis]
MGVAEESVERDSFRPISKELPSHHFAHLCCGN